MRKDVNMGVENQMSEMIAKTEAERGQAFSITELVTSLAGKNVKEEARNPDSLAYKAVHSHYPDILDRELLAGAIDKQILAPGTTLDIDIENLDARHKAAIDQGYPPAEYKGLIAKRGEYFAVREFLTTMNDTEFDITEQRLKAEAQAAASENQKETDKKETITKFQNYKITVPSEKAESGNVDLSLGEYLHGIAVKIHQGQTSKEEIITRIEHLKANLRFAIEPQMRSFIFEEYARKRKELAEEQLYWEREAILHELEEEDINKAQLSEYNFRIASIELDLIKQLIG